MSKPTIPFGWMPGHWGLKGKTRDIAQAEYELEGYDLELKLLSLNSSHLDNRAEVFERGKVELDFKHGYMSERDYEYTVAKYTEDETERQLKLLDLDYQYTDMRDRDYDKSKSTIKKESWVNVIDLNVREDTGNFELDWNEYFITELEETGFKGTSDEDIVNSWFSRICRDIAMSEYSGTGDFDEKLAEVESGRDGPTDKNGRRIIK